MTPQNVMVTRDGVSKLMDFGVAKTDARPATDAGAVKGTFSYMAPEQVRGKEVDRRADVFGLGVILHELTTGARLFRGTEIEVMTAIVETDAPAPSTRVPDYPADLEEIVMASLKRDRRSRIRSASDLALHIEHFAMRHGLRVGPRAIAHYVREVAPGERLREEDLGLVPDRPPSSDIELEPAPLLALDPIGGDEFSDAVLVDDAELVEEDDVEEIDSFDGKTIPPAPLEGFDEDLQQSGDRPVVLLDKAKKLSEPPDAEDSYLQELSRRLEEDPEDSEP